MTPEIEHMAEGLLPQARSEAWRRYQAAPQQLERAELESLASVGLAMAAARWALYCAERGFDPGCGQWPCTDPGTCSAARYFAAYALRRMRGAMLDHMRSADWVSRATRSRAKALLAAGQDLGAGEAELEERTGLSPRQIRETMAAVARRPVSMDAEPVDVADGADVEGQVTVSLALQAAAAVLRRQPLAVQAVLALRYHQGRDLKQIAAVIGRSEAETEDLHVTGVLAVHAAMTGILTDSTGSSSD